jgi:hypothetical protein
MKLVEKGIPQIHRKVFFFFWIKGTNVKLMENKPIETCLEKGTNGKLLGK